MPDLRYLGMVVRARYGIYEDDELVDQAISQQEVACFTSEQFERLVGEAKTEVEQQNQQLREGDNE